MRLSFTGWLATVVALLVIVLLAPTAPELVRDLRGGSFPDVALAAGSLLLLAIAAWTATIVAAVLTGASSALVAAVTPSFARDALLLGVAGVLVVAPAHAERQAPAQGSTSASTQHARHTVDGLPLPDRPDVTAPAPAPAAHRSGPVVAAPEEEQEPATAVEVRPGDTLWAIAARALPSGASDADIADATRRWYAANRAVIGADPDLIEPRQLLTPPSGKDRP